MAKPMLPLAVAAAFVLLGLAPVAWPADGLGQWTSISDGAIAALAAEGKQPGWPGGCGGITVDRATGDVYLVICDQGLWRSEDHGTRFQRVDGGAVGGRCEYGFSLDGDPESSRLMCFMIYGGSALIANRGAAHVGSSGSHLDFGATDWSDGKTMIAIHHESGGKACVSLDGGGGWRDLEAGIRCVGVFSATTFVCAKEGQPGTFRSSDGGATWAKVSELTPKGRALRCFKSRGYWTSAQGLMVSADQGATWSIQGAPIDAANGPFFGRDESHLAVVTREGVMESTDAGASWRQLAPPPPGVSFSDASQFANYGWDWRNGIVYFSTMGHPALRYQFQPLPEDLAKADKLLAQAAKIADPHSSSALDALLRLDLGTAALALDAERRERIATLTRDAHAELMARQQAVREGLARFGGSGDEAKALDRLITEQAKPYARTSLAAWFADARLVAQARRVCARVARRQAAPASPTAKQDLAAGLEDLARKATTPEFQRELERLAAQGRK
jgi:hypothetical protein